MNMRPGQEHLNADHVGPHVLRYVRLAQWQNREIPFTSYLRNSVLEFFGSFFTLSGLGHRVAVLLFVVQVVLVDIFLMRYMQSYPDEGYRREALMTLALDVPVLCHMLWYWREDSAARSTTTQWMCYSWMHAAKVVVLFCRVMPRLPNDVARSEGLNWSIGIWSFEIEILNIDHLYSPQTLSNLLLITPMIYSIFMLRVSASTFGSSFKRVTVDLILHYDMLWHVLFDMVDQVDMFSQARLAEAFDKTAVVDHQRTLVAIQSVIPIFLFVSMVLQSQVLPGVSVDQWKIPHTWPALGGEDEEHEQPRPREGRAREVRVQRRATTSSGNSSSCSSSRAGRHSQHRYQHQRPKQQKKQPQQPQQQQQQQQQQQDQQPQRSGRCTSQDSQQRDQPSTNSSASWTWTGLRDRVKAKQHFRTVKFGSPASSKSSKTASSTTAAPAERIGLSSDGNDNDKDNSKDSNSKDKGDNESSGNHHDFNDSSRGSAHNSLISRGDLNLRTSERGANDNAVAGDVSRGSKPVWRDLHVEEEACRAVDAAMYLPAGEVADERRYRSDATPTLLGRSLGFAPAPVEGDSQAIPHELSADGTCSNFKLAAEWEDLEAGGRCSHLQRAVQEALAGRNRGSTGVGPGGAGVGGGGGGGGVGDGLGADIATPSLPICAGLQPDRVRADSFKTCPNDDETPQGEGSQPSLTPRRKKTGRRTFLFPLQSRVSNRFLGRGASRRTEKSGATNASMAWDPQKRLFAQRERARRSRLQAILSLIQRHSIFMARKRATVISLFSVDLPFLALRLWIWIALDHTSDFTGFPGFGIKNIVCLVLNIIQFPLVAMAATDSYFTIQRQLAAYALRFGPPVRREGGREEPKVSNGSASWPEAQCPHSPGRNSQLGSASALLTSLYSPSEVPSLASTPNPFHAFATPYTDNTPSGIGSNYRFLYNAADPNACGRSHTLHSLDSTTGTVLSGVPGGSGALALERQRRAALWRAGVLEAEQQVRKDTESSAGICAHFWTLVLSFSCGLLLAKGDHYIIQLLSSVGRIAL